jgi:hypothetical protein
MRCQDKGCSWPAVGNTQFCASHQPTPIKQGNAAEEDISVVSISAIPPARANEVAMSLLKTVETLGEGKALKVKLVKFSKPTLITTQRYALVKGTRIGVRFIGAYAYVWKLTEQEIKSAEARGARLSEVRSRKKRKAAVA